MGGRQRTSLFLTKERSSEKTGGQSKGKVRGKKGK